MNVVIAGQMLDIFLAGDDEAAKERLTELAQEAGLNYEEDVKAAESWAAVAEALIAAVVVTVMLALWYPQPYFDAMGGELNAATSRETTVVYTRVPDGHLEQARELALGHELGACHQADARGEARGRGRRLCGADHRPRPVDAARRQGGDQRGDQWRRPWRARPRR